MIPPSDHMEIERKFLVRKLPKEAPVKQQNIRQGYIARENGNTVRIRQKDQNYILSIKAARSATVRYELEYDVSERDARLLFEICTGPVIEKTRKIYHHRGHVWEVDIFHGRNAGLVIAEVELKSAEEGVKVPNWIGREVSTDERFFNAYLFSRPFQDWGLSYEDLLDGK